MTSANENDIENNANNANNENNENQSNSSYVVNLRSSSNSNRRIRIPPLLVIEESEEDVFPTGFEPSHRIQTFPNLLTIRTLISPFSRIPRNNKNSV